MYSEKNTSVSLSKELRTQPVCQLGLSTPSPSRVKNIAWKLLKFSSLFLDTKPSISSNGFCRSVHYNPINCHGCLFHLSVAFLDFDNYLVSLFTCRALSIEESGLRNEIIGPFIRGKIRRELYHLYELVLSNKPRRILDEMCRLYGKFASYSSHVLCKTRLIFPRINGPNDSTASWPSARTCIKHGSVSLIVVDS